MNADLLDQICKTESDRVEWKQSVDAADEILRAVCALANDLGATGTEGWVVIGLAKDGTVTGIDERGAQIDAEMKRLADRLRSIKLQPTPSTAVELVERSGRKLLVVSVAPYPVPPVVELDQTAWVRVGTTTRRASDADRTRLSERRPERTRPFDTKTVAGAVLADLQTSRLRNEYETQRNTDSNPETFPKFESWLETRRESGRWTGSTFEPNTAAILVYGVDPRAFLPGAFVDLVRYAGESVESPIILRKTIAGTLPEQIDALDAQFKNQIVSVETPEVGARQAYVPEYPERALRELARNLVQHRTYEHTHAPARVEWFCDRIEFSNPGGPYQRAGDGEFGSQADYRNPLVTKKLVETGHVQQLGRGIRIARAELEKNGNPPLEVETDGFTRVIVRRRA